MSTLEEKLTVSIRKYFIEPNPIEDSNRVRAVVQDVLRLCGEELGYSDMNAARRALLPPSESTKSFVERHNAAVARRRDDSKREPL